MTDIAPGTDNAAPLIIAVGGIIYGAFEAQLIVIFLCAVLGAGIGLAFRPAPAPTNNRLELLLRFAGNSGYILCNAVITCFASYWVSKYLPGADYPMAFFISLIIMIYREHIIDVVGAMIKRKSEGI